MSHWSLARWAVAAGLVLALAGLDAARAQAPAKPPTDVELNRHLESLQRKLDDPLLDVALRDRIALEMAATLDRAAQAAPTPEARRDRWKQAVDVLDRYTRAHPSHALAGAFEVQAAVYLWARARSWVDPARVGLADEATRARATDDLEASARRLRAAVGSYGDTNDVYAQNARFRLSQTLADLAEVGPGDAVDRRGRNAEALEALDRPLTEQTLQGFGHLLRATLLARLDRFDEAQKEIDAAAAARPALPEPDLLDVRLAVLLGKGRFADARKAVDASRLDKPARLAWKVRVGVAERRALPAGAGRDAAEAALFRDLKALRDASRAQGTASLVAAATDIREPAPGQEPDAWDLLADGALFLGQPDRAGALEAQGADRAEALGRARQAAELRLKAGAALFQAEKFDQADAALTRVADDPQAGDLRPRAGLLRALARGRALALGRPGASASAYARALREQVKSFPDDPSAAEARWLLGKLVLAEGDKDEALALWDAIPHGTPRWLEARVEMAEVRRQELDTQRLNGDADAVSKRLDEARSFLAACLEQARGETEVNDLLLARARLELTPNAGRPETARESVDRVLHSAAWPAQRDAARRLRLVALAQSSRFVEAEQAARREAVAVPGAPASADPTALIDTVRLLDRSAAESDSDLRSRRMGLLMTILIRPVAEHAGTLPPASRAEVRLREIRGRLFSGDDVEARRAIAGWSAPSLSSNPGLLRDLADTYVRLEAYELAVDVQRLRSKLLPNGSLPWFDARYGLALAYYRSGKTKDALHLIDATAILHPDLGGGELRAKFIRLRQRIEPAG
jgi:tetratricopeptide (TPR) repeat protein